MNNDTHPSKIPVDKTFDIKDELEAEKIANEMVEKGFDVAYKILMPKERKIAKRIGYAVTTSVNYGLRKSGKNRDVRYWTYHEDENHYAIVFASSTLAEKFGL